MGLSLDGYAKNTGGGNATGGTVTFSNTNAGDLIELVVFAEADGKAGSPFSITTVSSTSSLAWTRRKQFQSTLNGGSFIEKWYAVAAGILTNEVVTFTFNATMDDYAAFVRGWSGADTVTPYDTNASLPATNSGTTGDPSVASCSTTAASTVMTSDFGSGNSTTAFTVPSGWTSCGANPGTLNGNLAADAAGAFQIETSAQSNLTVTWGTAITNWLAIVDAVRAAPAPSGNRSQSVSVGF